jgi:lysophospholipase L1-like esterase
VLVSPWGGAPARADGPFDQWEPEISAFEASDRTSPPPKNAVVFVGSSSIRLWTGLEADFPGTPVVNRGFGGSQLPDSTHFAGRIVTPYRPRTIVLYAGDNDLASGRTPEQVADDFREFVRRARADLPKVKIVFVSIKPSPARVQLLPRMRETNDRIRREIEQGKRLAYVDVFTPMLGADGAPRPELFGPDGLHMNRAGYALWAARLRPVIR